MRLTEAREGRTQTQVLAAVADFQFNQGKLPRQKDITEKLPISKGAVSNNCKKLIDSGLVIEEEREYSVDEEKLLTVYREHIEDYLSRESKTPSFEEEVNAHNEIRTRTKRELRSFFEDEETSQLILSILVQALIDSLEKPQTQTLRETLLWTDQLVSETAERIARGLERPDPEGEDWQKIRLLFMLAVSFNKTHSQLSNIREEQPFLKEYIPSHSRSVEDDMVDILESKDEYNNRGD